MADSLMTIEKLSDTLSDNYFGGALEIARACLYILYFGPHRFLLIALLMSIFRGDEGLSLSSIVFNDQWINVTISRFQL